MDPMRFVLDEVDDHTKPARLRGIVKEEAGVLCVYLDGYGNCNMQPGEGLVVAIQLSNGKPKAIVFGNINQEEPTATLSLEGASEKVRDP